MNDSIFESVDGTKIIVKGDNGRSVTISVTELLEIDDQNLVAEFSRQASIFAWIAVLAAKAERNASIAEVVSEREYAVADQSFREELEMQGKKPTEPMIKQLINTDEAYRETQDVVQDAKYEYKLMKALAAALEMRASMLVSMGAYIRHEIDMTGMTIKQRQYDSAVEETKKVLQSRRK